jgi:hypothetical protein
MEFHALPLLNNSKGNDNQAIEILNIGHYQLLAENILKVSLPLLHICRESVSSLSGQ